MKRLSELVSVLNSLQDVAGIRWTDTAWEPSEVPAPPYVCLVGTFGDYGSHADDKSWIPLMTYDVELYDRHRNREAERQLERALDDAGFPTDKNVSFIESEGLVEAYYSVTVSDG